MLGYYMILSAISGLCMTLGLWGALPFSRAFLLGTAVFVFSLIVVAMARRLDDIFNKICNIIYIIREIQKK